MTQPQNTSTFAWIGRQKWILVVAAIMAAAVTAYWYFSSYRPKSEATEYIAKLLLDPGSAEFRDVSVEELIGLDVYIACGEVNGKNLHGAYTGYKPFIYFHSKSLLSFGYIGNELPVTGDAVLDALRVGVVFATAEQFKSLKARGDTESRKCNEHGKT